MLVDVYFCYNDNRKRNLHIVDAYEKVLSKEYRLKELSKVVDPRFCDVLLFYNIFHSII